MSNGDTGFWTGSLNYSPSWSSTPYIVNFGQTDYSVNGTAPTVGYLGQVAAFGPLDSWELNGNANDDVAPVNNGTQHNVTFGNASTAIVGQTSASFNGTTSYIQTPVNPSGYTQLTVSIWVNLNGQSQTAASRFIANSDGGPHGFEMALSAGSLVPCWRIGNGTTSSTLFATTGAIASTGWVHLVGTWDGNTTALYSNGALVGTSTLSGGTLSPGPTGVQIGQNVSVGGNFFNGLMQGAAILPVALTSAQVAQLYSTAGTPNAPGVGGVDWMWMSIQGWDSPPVSGSVVQRASDHGGWPTDQYFAPRTMTLTVHASAPTQAARDQARAELQAAIPVNDLALLTYNEPVPKQAMVRRSGQIVETYADLTDVEFACVLVAPDPRKYTTSIKSFQTTAPNVATGVTIPSVFAPSNSEYNLGYYSVNSNQTAAGFTISTAVPVGGGVIVAMSCGNATAQTVTAADSRGNTYTLVATSQNSSAPAETVFVLTAPVTTALAVGDTVTVTTTNSQVMSAIGMAVPYYSGIDTVNTGSGNSATPSIISNAPSNANTITFAFFANNASKSATTPIDGRGWANDLTTITTGTVSLDSFSVNNVSTSPVNCASTYGSSTQWAAASVVVDISPPPVGSNVAFTARNSSNPVTVTSWNISVPSPGIKYGISVFVQVSGNNSSVGSLTVTDSRSNPYALVNMVANAASGATMFEATYASYEITKALQPGDVISFSGATSSSYMSTLWTGNVFTPTGNVADNFGTGTTASVSISGVAGNTVLALPGSPGVMGATPTGWNLVSSNAGNGFDNLCVWQYSAGSSASLSCTAVSPWLAMAIAYVTPMLPNLPGMIPGGSVTVTNNGNFETRPIITVTGPITAPTITLDGTQTISFSNLTLATGDKLVLNTDTKTAMLNGSYRPSDISSWWWVLQPGSHNIQLGGATTGGATLQVTYQDAWI